MCLLMLEKPKKGQEKLKRLERTKFLLKFVILKSLKLFHGQDKRTSNLLSNPNRGFLTAEAQKPEQ